MMFIKKVFLWAALGLTATATLTSCEDILGHWEKPTPVVPASAVEDARVLGAALEAGATVSVNYTVGSTSYVATFQKNADDTYTLLSNTAAASGARATTRMIAPPVYTVPVGDAAAGNVLLELVGDKLVFTVKTADGAPIFKAEMNVEGGEVTVVNTNGGGQDCTIGQVSVGDQAKAIVNPEMKWVNILDNSETVKYAVKYSEGETWADVVKRYEGVDVVKITTSDDDDRITVEFSKDFIVATLMATGDYNKEQAEEVYNNSYASTFYLTTTTSNFVSGSRAMTRSVASTHYVTKDEKVGDAETYKLKRPVVTDLSTTSSAYTAQDGVTLTGTLNNKVQISIAAGATVVLENLTINGTTEGGYYFSGITCNGDATIILKGTNTVKGFGEIYPGIYVPENYTLTIMGTGTLNASASSFVNGTGSGIGCGNQSNCGNIVIKSGTINATGGAGAAGIGGAFSAGCGTITILGGTIKAKGGENAAGIGSGFGYTTGITSSCGNITISGGTVIATGGENAAGIGGGYANGGLTNCGNITVESTVTSVTATKGADAPNSIGAGKAGDNGTATCGTVTIADGANVTRN